MTCTMRSALHRRHGLWVMGYGLRAMGYGIWVTGYGLWVMGYGLWVMGYGLWVMGYGLWVMGYGLWASSRQRPARRDEIHASHNPEHPRAAIFRPRAS